MEKTYLIIGAGSGIGLSLTQQLTGAGHAVIGTQRSADNFPQIENTEFQVYDVTKPEDTLELPEQIDGLVYCPGTIALKPFARLTDGDFQQDWEINLLGAIRTIRLVLPSLKKAPHASIVLFSTVAVQTGMRFHASIAAAKGAVEGLTRSLAAELAPGIRVNAIAPSLTDTRLAESLLDTSQKKDAAAKRHPLNSVGTPEQIAGTAALLLSETAAFTTGQILQVDGGMSSMRLF